MIITKEQAVKVAEVAEKYIGTRVIIHDKPFELPDGYIWIEVCNDTGPLVHGGIAPDGRIST